MSTPHPIDELCDLLGIATMYLNDAGVWQKPPQTTLLALLSALGYPAETEDLGRASLARFWADIAARIVDPVTVCREDTKSPWTIVTLPADHGDQVIQWKFFSELGTQLSGSTRFGDLPLVDTIMAGTRAHGRRRLVLPTTLPLGYHRIEVAVAGSTVAGTIVGVPNRAYQPPGFNEGPDDDRNASGRGELDPREVTWSHPS